MKKNNTNVNKISKSAEKKALKQAQYLSSRVPYIKCFEEKGLIEIEANKYSVSYKIEIPENNSNIKYIDKIAYECMTRLFLLLKDFEFRFTIRNSLINKDEYLNSIYIKDNKDATLNDIIKDYNFVLTDNVDIGHNNFKSSLYLTIVTSADLPEKAIDKFESIDAELKAILNDLYNYNAILMSLTERLEVLYHMYNPEENAPEFGKKVNYDGNGFSIASMQKMKMTTKDMVAPTKYEAKECDYMRIGNKYSRLFFINSIPSTVSSTLLSDIISISSNSILSISYQPIDTQLGFDTIAQEVKDNTNVKEIQIKDSVADRKAKRTKITKTMINENEEDYFNNVAIETLTDSVAKSEPLFLTTFIICLYADTLEDLDRDTILLYTSTNKYFVQTETCDYQQNEAFISALPLGNMKVDYERTFNVDKLSKLLPFNIQHLFENQTTFQGLNEFNDNFIMIDRSNYNIGLITGKANAGKTIAMKREIINNLITTDDSVIIISPKNKVNEYDDFVKSLNGQIYDAVNSDLFTIDENYGLNTDNKTFLKMFFESFITFRTKFYEDNYNTEDLNNIYKEIEKEAKEIAEFSDYMTAISYAREHNKDFKLFNAALESYIPTSEYPNLGASRISLIHYNNNPAELLTTLNYLWNYVIAMKKANMNVSIYVESIDDFLYTPVTSDYLMELINKCSKLKVPFTMSIQNCARIAANDTAKIELDYFLGKVEYFKILSMGVIERKIFKDKLNISSAILPYIIDREPGEGIIITPTSNIAFNDRFLNMNNDFYNRFAV